MKKFISNLLVAVFLCGINCIYSVSAAPFLLYTDVTTIPNMYFYMNNGTQVYLTTGDHITFTDSAGNIYKATTQNNHVFVTFISGPQATVGATPAAITAAAPAVKFDDAVGSNAFIDPAGIKYVISINLKGYRILRDNNLGLVCYSQSGGFYDSHGKIITSGFAHFLTDPKSGIQNRAVFINPNDNQLIMCDAQGNLYSGSGLLKQQ